MGSLNEGYQVQSPSTSYVTTDIRPDNNFDSPGIIWKDLDFQTPLGVRSYKWLQNNGTNTATTAVGDVVVFADNYALTVSTAQADSSANCLAGVAVAVVPKGSWGWFQTDGYCPVVLVDNSTFALGTQIMIKAGTDKTGTTVGAAGTAPTYPVIGTALAAGTGTNPYYVVARLHIGRFGG